MKILSKDFNESECYKYIVSSKDGKKEFIVAVKSDDGKVIKEQVSETLFRENECRLVDYR